MVTHIKIGKLKISYGLQSLNTEDGRSPFSGCITSKFISYTWKGVTKTLFTWGVKNNYSLKK